MPCDHCSIPAAGAGGLYLAEPAASRLETRELRRCRKIRVCCVVSTASRPAAAPLRHRGPSISSKLRRGCGSSAGARRCATCRHLLAAPRNALTAILRHLVLGSSVCDRAPSLQTLQHFRKPASSRQRDPMPRRRGVVPRRASSSALRNQNVTNATRRTKIDGWFGLKEERAEGKGEEERRGRATGQGGSTAAAAATKNPRPKSF
jgi:hypothetical protein